MNNIQRSTQQIVEDMIHTGEAIILTKDNFESLLATLEEEHDEESIKARKEAEEDIKNNNLIPLSDIL